MVSKNNRKLLDERLGEKVPRYALRRFKVGVASVAIGAALIFSSQLALDGVSAAETQIDESPAVELLVESPPLVEEESPVSEEAIIEEEISEDQSTSELNEEEDLFLSQEVQTLANEEDSDEVEPSPVETEHIPALMTLSTSQVQSQSLEDPIAEGHFRIHFSNLTDEQLADLGLWIWGGVESPSSGDFPKDGLSLAQAVKSEYGHYIDLSQSEVASEIGYILLDRSLEGDDSKLTDDQTIELIAPEMNQAWLDDQYGVHSYEPLEDESIVRVNYYREDNNYEGWGLWLWNQVVNPSDDWPNDALEFVNEGPFGRYVDVDLANGLDSAIGFLLVNKLTGDQSNDMSFTGRQEDSQIFLRETEAEVYTNPYFVAEAEDDYENAEPGQENIQIEARVNRDFNYNESAVIELEITNPNNVTINRIVADASAIGGSEELEISPELKKITITASHDIAPGDYVLPIRVYDESIGYYDSSVTVTLVERDKGPNERDWDEEVIYFMLTDRFADGDPSNNNPYDLPYSEADNIRGTYQGGDFKGVTNNLDYLHDLGITTIWITPIVENVGHDVSYGSDDGEYYGYHGYWAQNFEALNPHLGTLEEFHQLIDEAADRGIKIMVDVVLNHAGYGMDSDLDNLPDPLPPAFPSIEDIERFEEMFRTEIGPDGDLHVPLSNLPDFLTELAHVRQQLVAWQTDWLAKSTTANGNAIASFRVDTVKHVDDSTWQDFRNALAEQDPDFRLIGEYWGARPNNEGGYLEQGMMDSLLDFGFKDIARQLVNGDLDGAQKSLSERNDYIQSNKGLGQFLGSHDEDGFLYSLNNDLSKYLLAVTAQLTAKGQPVIYYGEELGQTGANNWPVYDNRYDFAWDQVENNPVLDHYRKLLDFRSTYSELLARGSHDKFGGSNADGWLMSERNLGDQSAYITYNVATQAKEIWLEVSSADTIVRDHYSGQNFTPTQNANGAWVVNLEAPSIDDGGTLLLTADNGQLIRASNPLAELPPIEEGFFRLHFENLPSDNLDELGLWIWEDVAVPSEQEEGGWPTGAMSFEQAQTSDFGYFLDFRMIDDIRDSIGFLINDRAGANLTGDRFVNVVSQEMNQAWVDEDYNIFAYQPLAIDDTIRINYLREDGDYEGLKLWSWGNVETPDTAITDFEMGENGAYFDVRLSDLNEAIGFLFLEGDWDWQTGDYAFANTDLHTQIFLRENDSTVYVNPYYVGHVELEGARQDSLTELSLSFGSLDGVTEDDVRDNLVVYDGQGNEVAVTDFTIDTDTNRIIIKGDFSGTNYTVRYDTTERDSWRSWQLTDELFAYEGDLGVDLRQDGSAELKVWSPSADKISIILYDKNDPDKVVGHYDMSRGQDQDNQGVWNVILDSATTGLDSLRGYYYHYEIERNGEKVLTLDPYAASLAAWDNGAEGAYVAKAAIVDPSTLGPELDYAQIPGYTQREDAIIYEVHVRDFTSDYEIADDLQARFGTFAALVEKLDYAQQLGVTHIQLLPVMSYYYINELLAAERELDWSSTGNNYNWGYDPQSYFALTGAYSEDPTNPEERITEFKNLIDEIHNRGMGVILDVVYNHTARTHLFEDLEPNYYHFMDNDGTPRESFGGGRLGTTHAMARRILVDSITYWVEEYKVDGFRFDMMGDHDAEAIQMAYDKAAALNPNILMIGEGWVTFAGDEGDSRQPADQSWMDKTDSVGVFSDEIRNELKSGFGHEGQPMFLTGGVRNIWKLFNNIAAQPHNFDADDPGDVVQYIEAHDNLTLYDVIALSIKKDPDLHDVEIHKRLRMGNTIILTSQGTSFIHAGQEYGRTKQYRTETDSAPYKSTYMVDEEGNPFNYPYFIHDSYDSSDMINRFEWEKVRDEDAYLQNIISKNYTQGLMFLRRSTDAFTQSTLADVENNMVLITDPDLSEEVSDFDLLIGYQVQASNGDRYAVFVNGDENARSFNFGDRFSHLMDGVIIVDGLQAGTNAIHNPYGVSLVDNTITLDGLTSVVIALRSHEQDIVMAEEMDIVLGSEIDYSDFFTDLPPGAQIGQVLVAANAKHAGQSLALVEIVFADGSTRAVTVAVNVVEEIIVDPVEPVNPVDPGDPTDPESSPDEDLVIADTVPINTASTLPATGEESSAIFGLAAASILAGLGLLAVDLKSKKKKEEN